MSPEMQNLLAMLLAKDQAPQSQTSGGESNMSEETKDNAKEAARVAKVYAEHNGSQPYADTQRQCQCKDCKAYRG